MKNYYEILEVAKNASPEVIEKAYKTLIKKYHPDLQPNDKKKDAENKVKLINEAYDVLSDPTKKENYDNELNQLEHQKEIERQRQIEREKQVQNYHQNSSIMTNKTPSKTVSTQQNSYQEQIDKINAINKAYNDAYVSALRNMGYKVRYKKTFKQYLKMLFSIICTIFSLIIISIILWHIPFIKKFLIDLYNNNQFIKIVVDIINRFFTNFISLFKK